MADKEYFVGGYYFSSKEDVKQAQKEQKQAEYFESKLEGRNGPGMLAAYDKILDQKIFVTPIGWTYLLSLQEKLRLLGIAEEKIRPVPMYFNFSLNSNKEKEVKQRIVSSGNKSKSDKEKISVILNIVLAGLVLTMFGIALSGNNPNILNYKRVILNEYASWEQDLTQREQELKKKEAELLNGTDKSFSGTSAEEEKEGNLYEE